MGPRLGERTCGCGVLDWQGRSLGSMVILGTGMKAARELWISGPAHRHRAFCGVDLSRPRDCGVHLRPDRSGKAALLSLRSPWWHQGDIT